MQTRWRHGLLVTEDTGEIVRRLGEIATPKAERGWARRALDRSGQVKTFTFETMTQVAARPVTKEAQGRLF